MSTKEDLTESINNLLGLDLESLGRMTKEDLRSLYNVLSKRLGSSPVSLTPEGDFFRRPLKDILNKRILNKPLGELSLKEIFEALTYRENGPLGLGLIPALRKAISVNKKSEKPEKEEEHQLEP